jgi:hypothetical protein
MLRDPARTSNGNIPFNLQHRSVTTVNINGVPKGVNDTFLKAAITLFQVPVLPPFFYGTDAF